MKMGFAVEGIDDVKEILERIAPKHSRNLLRSTVYGAAATVGKIARKHAPKGETGRLKRAIKWRRRKSSPQKPISEVYVNRGTSRKDPTGAFYWHFIEHGTQGYKNHPGIPAEPFIQPARVHFVKNKNRIISEQFVKKYNAKVKLEQKKRRR